jgi:hypothetical protein
MRVHKIKSLRKGPKYVCSRMHMRRERIIRHERIDCVLCLRPGTTTRDGVAVYNNASNTTAKRLVSDIIDQIWGHETFVTHHHTTLVD